MSDKIENEIKPAVRDSKTPVFWIPFSIASILLVVIGLFRFSDSADNIYFIYICLIAFALAALPWITSFRVNGLFEIERAIEQTKNDTRDRIEQTDKRFDDRLFSLRSELMASLTSIQSQVSQQSSILNSTQSQVSQQSTLQTLRQSNSQIIAIGDAVKTFELIEAKSSDEKPSNREGKISTTENVPRNEITVTQTELLELRTGFAQSAAAALNDPLGLKCSELMRKIHDSGVHMSMFHELRSVLEITDEQYQTLKNLKLISISLPESEQNELVRVSKLGRIYSEYWELNLPSSASSALSETVIPFLGAIAGALLANTFTTRIKEAIGKK